VTPYVEHQTDSSSAHKVGIKAAWINRPKAIMGVKGLGEEPDFEYPSMEAFADAMEKLHA
jgi:2-haloacid dehalogenase